jgi:hypothetical protein
MSDTRQFVQRFALEQPAWVVVLEAACTQANAAEPSGGPVRRELRRTGVDAQGRDSRSMCPDSANS